MHAAGLKYPPLPRLPSGEASHGVVGALIRLLLCFDPDASDPQPLRHVLSSPSLLLLASRNLEHRRRRNPTLTRSDVVQEVLHIAMALLEYVHRRTTVLGDIPVGAVLTQCVVQPSGMRLSPVVDALRQGPFTNADVLFVLRGIHEIRWKTAGEGWRRWDPSCRLTPSRNKPSNPTPLFRCAEAPVLRVIGRDASFALGSVHRRQWRSLPASAYSDADATWTLTAQRRIASPRPAMKTTYIRMSPAGVSTDMASVYRAAFTKRVQHWLFSEVFNRVQRRFNQSVLKYKAPDRIPVVDKPAPTLTQPERRVSYEMRRMVPNIHAQRYRGIQYRPANPSSAAAVLYWYNSHYVDILATLSEIENRLSKKGLQLLPSMLTETTVQQTKTVTKKQHRR